MLTCALLTGEALALFQTLISYHFEVRISTAPARTLPPIASALRAAL